MVVGSVVDVIRLTERAIAEGCVRVEVGGGKWLVRSGRDETVWYITRLTECSCPAGVAGRLCKHRAMVVVGADWVRYGIRVVDRDGVDVVEVGGG